MTGAERRSRESREGGAGLQEMASVHGGLGRSAEAPVMAPKGTAIGRPASAYYLVAPDPASTHDVRVAVSA